MNPRIKVSFSLFGSCDVIESISNRLSIDTAKIMRKADFKNPLYAEDSWTIEIEYEQALEMSVLTDRIYSKLYDRISLINKIKRELSLNSLFMIVIQADTNNMPITVLNRNIIMLANETNSEIHFDNYFYND